MKTITRADLLAALAFILAAIAFLWETTIGGKILLPADNIYAFPPFNSLIASSYVPHNLLISDMLLQNISWKNLARDAVLNGAVPLWNPYILAGVPFLAAGQPAVLYPLGAVFFVFRPEQAYGWFTATQIALAGMFMYCYLRVIGVNRFGAIVSGFTFMLSSFLVVSFLWPMVVSTAIWVPLLLAAIEAVIQRFENGEGFRVIIVWSAIGAVALGMQFLAGHMEISFYVLFTMLYYAVCRLAIALVHVRSIPRVLQAGTVLLAMVALGTGLALAQLLPFQEVIRENFRSGFVTYSDVIGWALPKMQLATFVMPDFFGNPTHHTYFDFLELKTKVVADNAFGEPTDPPSTVFWGVKNYVEAASYVGILPLILAVAAVVFRRTRYTLIFTSYAVFSLLLAFGSPLYAIFFYGIPGFDQLHTPFRWIFPYTVSIAVLAGLGGDYLFRHERETLGASKYSWFGTKQAAGMILPRDTGVLRQRAVARKSAESSYALLALIFGLLVVMLLALSLLFRERTLALLAAIFSSSTRLRRAFADPQMFFSYEFRNLIIFGILLLASGGILYLSAKQSHRLPVWRALALALLLVDLFYFGVSFNTASTSEPLDAVTKGIRMLQDDKSLYRIATFGTDDILKPNLGMRFGLQDIRGYDTIILKQYVEFWRLMEEPHGLLYSMIKTLDQQTSLGSKWLDLLNVKYVLSSQPINVDGLELIYKGEMAIYRNPDVMARSFIVHKARPVTSSEEALAALRDENFDPRTEVILEGWVPNSQPQLNDSQGESRAAITKYSYNQVVIDLLASSAGFLVLADSYFPGWQAFVDGKETTVYRANRAFRAVQIPAGSHQVVFRYSPLTFKLGLLGSGISGLTIILATSVAIASRYFNRGGEITVQRVAKNSLAPMATSLLNKAIDIAFAMLMLRLLGPENVGKYLFASIVYAYFEIFTNFGLTTLAQREVAKDRAKGNTYLSNSLIVRLVLVLLAFPAIAAFIHLWGALFALDQDTTLAIVLLSLALLPANIAAAFSSLFLAFERMEVPALVTVATTLLKVALGSIALLFGWGIVGLAGVSVVVNAVTATIFVLLVSKILFRPCFELDSKLASSMLRTSWPLMINQMLATMFFRIDIPIMQSVRSDREVGYYGTAYKFIDGLNIIPSSFTIALFPVLSRYADSAREAFIRAYAMALRFLLLLSLPIAVGTFFLAEPIILLLGGREYLPDSAIALQVLIWFLPFSYINSLTQYVLIAINQQRFITISFVIATMFNIVANLILIPRYGYVGAALVTIISEIVLMLPFLYAVFQHLGRVSLISLAIRPAIASAIMAGVLWQIRPLAAPYLVLAGATTYTLALVVLRTFRAEDIELARKLLGRGPA